MWLSIHHRIAAVLVCTLSFCGSARSQTSVPLEASARKAWVEYEKAARMWSYTIHLEITKRDKGESAHHTGSWTVKTNDRCISIERTDLDPVDTDPQTCHVTNSMYEFTARRVRGNTMWGLTGGGEYASRKAPGPRGRLSGRDDIQTETVLAAVSWQWMPVSRLIDHPCCRTTRFAQTAEGVEWVFSIDRSQCPEGAGPGLSGRIVFDPANHWVIKEHVSDALNGRGSTTTRRDVMAYSPGPNGLPMLREIVNHLETDDKTFQVDRKMVFEPIHHEQPFRDSEFTLTAYGMPESALHTTSLAKVAFNQRVGAPVIAQAPAPTWYWWLIGIAAALVALGGILRMVGRFRRQSS